MNVFGTYAPILKDFNLDMRVKRRDASLYRKLQKEGLAGLQVLL
jgi:hypothetical protein